MSQHNSAASQGAQQSEMQQSETQHDEPRKNGAQQHAAPRGLGPTGAPWTYPKRCFEPDFLSPNVALTPLNQVATKEPVWECRGRLRRGAVTIVAGEHGSGKSLLAVDWAARVTCGERNQKGEPHRNGEPGEAVIAHACDLSLDLLRRRINAAGATPERIASLALAYPDDDKEFTIDTIRRRVISLASAARGSNNVRLLVIDNLEAWAGNYHEPPSAALLGFLLAQLTELATQAEIAILVLAQLPRAGGQAAARKLDQLTALAPVVYLAASDPGRPSRKLLLPVKNNLAASSAASFEAVDGRIVWSEAPVDAAADEFIAPLSRRLEARHERETAARWLLDALADGPIESRELFRQARDCGIAARTLRRAAQLLGLSPRKTSFRGPWQWQSGEAGGSRKSEAPASGGREALVSVSKAPPETEANASGSPNAKLANGRGASKAETGADQGGQPRGASLAAAESGSPSARGADGRENRREPALTLAG